LSSCRDGSDDQSGARNTSEALMPPKPNEFDITTDGSHAMPPFGT
jgi:hypothetical protein